MKSSGSSTKYKHLYPEGLNPSIDSIPSPAESSMGSQSKDKAQDSKRRCFTDSPESRNSINVSIPMAECSFQSPQALVPCSEATSRER